MVGIQFQIQQEDEIAEETATNEPASNEELTQHEPQTMADWAQWLIIAGLIFVVYKNA